MDQLWKVVRIKAGPLPPDAMDELVAVLQAVLPTCGAHEALTEGEREWRLFFEPEDLPSDVERDIRQTAGESGYGEIEVLGVIDVLRENWQENWRQYFKPVPISPSLEIHPSWYKASQPSPEGRSGDKIVLYIEPGMAFGTGTHATTQLCLRKSENVIKPGMAILDCGTGSAILAIAAVRLGATRAVGFDIDPEVEENARLNLALNDLPADAIDIRIGGLQSVPDEKFDVIFCNMLSREFLPLLPDLPSYLADSGLLILSGLLTTEEADIREAAEKAGLRIADCDNADEWTVLICSRR